MKRAVVLLSGGLDSVTALAIAKEQGFECYTLSFNYGQRHDAELVAAEILSKQTGAIEHKVINIDLRTIGGSALTDNTSRRDPRHLCSSKEYRLFVYRSGLGRSSFSTRYIYRC